MRRFLFVTIQSMSTLIDRIKVRTATGKDAPKYSPVTNAAILKTESALGFPIPPLLKQIYTEIGDGGFGPGYGIISTNGGYEPYQENLVELYKSVQQGSQYLRLQWRPKLLPFCEWGCNIFTCVDCTDYNAVLYQSEECAAKKLKYRLEDFFEMWLDGIDILNNDRPPPKAIEGVNPFTKKKETYFGSSKKPK